MHSTQERDPGEGDDRNTKPEELRLDRADAIEHDKGQSGKREPALRHSGCNYLSSQNLSASGGT